MVEGPRKSADKESSSIGNVEVFRDQDGLVEAIQLKGGVLVLHGDSQRIRQQFGESGQRETVLPPDNEMIGGISTDAIIAARPDCYRFDESLGEVPLRTLEVGDQKQKPIGPNDILRGEFAAIAAGADWGCGSSREHAALALLYAGIGVVYAPSIAPIHLNNLVNSGMFPVRDRGIMERLMNGEKIGIDELTKGLGAFDNRVMRRGGLFPFMKAWANGEEPMPMIDTGPRPMTVVEKIMAANMPSENGYVKPGDAGMLEADVTLAHDYTTAQAEKMITDGLGRPPQVRSPGRHHTFPDHLTLIVQGKAEATQEEIKAVMALREGQKRVAEQTGIHFHGRSFEDVREGADGICHFVFREKIVKPGQVVVGTDSHTCSAGALNTFAFGVGSAQIGTAWEHDVVPTSVPETVQIVFTGKLPPQCSGKDVMLILARLNKQNGSLNGRVMEFSGEGLEGMTADDQWVLANMATECSAKTGIVTPNSVMRRYLTEKRQMDPAEVEAAMVYPDAGAQYTQTITIDLSTITPHVSTPGHTGNAVPLDEVAGRAIDKVYSGSCTSGSIEVLRTIAAIVQGRQVQVLTHVQAGSLEVLMQAQREGLLAVLKEAGIVVIEEPGCGACLAAGPGGPAEGEVAMSDTNRNFPGRMGEGHAYLAGPAIVAVTALLGHIPDEQELQAHLQSVQ